MVTERLRYKRLSATTKRMLATEGESGRFEFKREAQAVSAPVLVAAANTAAVERLEQITILVGVDEDKDPDTGLVTGKVVGLDDLDRDRELIRSRGASTLPVPVGLTIVEENVTTDKPILRLIVRPTLPPHYDARGARLIRYEASTRPLTDPEMLAIYLDREAESFHQRFAAIAGQLQSAVDDLWGQITAMDEQVSADLVRIHESAELAAVESEEGRSTTQDIRSGIEDIVFLIRETLPSWSDTFEGVWSSLLQYRAIGLSRLAAREARRPAKALSEARKVLTAVLETGDPSDYRRNAEEIEAWQKFASLRLNGAATSYLDAAKVIHSARFDPLNRPNLPQGPDR